METKTIKQWLSTHGLTEAGIQSPYRIEPDTAITGPVGTCDDGINRADVYRLDSGEYLIDASTATVVQEDDPRS